jgi:hypothetical protein
MGADVLALALALAGGITAAVQRAWAVVLVAASVVVLILDLGIKL